LGEEAPEGSRKTGKPKHSLLEKVPTRDLTGCQGKGWQGVAERSKKGERREKREELMRKGKNGQEMGRRGKERIVGKKCICNLEKEGAQKRHQWPGMVAHTCNPSY
jgi:hypothetical protein